jgi:pimeloyl-ACP methyl ester carboxylesterase
MKPEARVVRRRHVIYVPGYDPRGLAEYFRLFRTEYARFLTLYGLQGKMSRPQHPDDRFAATWTINTETRDWNVETTYEFLRWEDIIRRDFARPKWWKILRALRVLVISFTSGAFARFARASWRFAVFVAYPFIVLLALALTSLLAGMAATSIARPLFSEPMAAVAIGAAAGVAALAALLRWTERYTYMLYLFDDSISTYQFGNGERPDWEERFDIFAGYLVEAAKAAAVDEIVVVGHSSGSFVAVEVVARALARDPGLGRHGAAVSLLTVGANLPIVGFNPKAEKFRERLRRLAVEPDVRWVEYQSRKDVMNFHPFDPIAGHGIDAGAARQNPTVVSVTFRDIILPESYPLFRWRFFRVHFQFVMANERPAAYDFYMTVCGPFPLALRAAQPADVLAAVAGDATQADAAWQRLRGMTKARVEPEQRTH